MEDPGPVPLSALHLKHVVLSLRFIASWVQGSQLLQVPAPPLRGGREGGGAEGPRAKLAESLKGALPGAFPRDFHLRLIVRGGPGRPSLQGSLGN